MNTKDVHVICIQNEFANKENKDSEHIIGTKSTLSNVKREYNEYTLELRHQCNKSSYGYFGNIVNDVILLPYGDGKHALYVLDLSDEDKFQASLDGTLHSDFTCVTNDVDVDITEHRKMPMCDITSHIMHGYSYVDHNDV